MTLLVRMFRPVPDRPRRLLLAAVLILLVALLNSCGPVGNTSPLDRAEDAVFRPLPGGLLFLPRVSPSPVPCIPPVMGPAPSF